jgi:arabinoxylan arabinofuranohydrolase
VDYEDFTNIKKNTRINTLGNDASENMQVKMKDGSWISQRNVDFGENGAAQFTLRAKGTAKLELRFARAGRPIATIEFSSTEMENQTFEIDAAKFLGTKSSFLLAVKSATNFYVDAWQFSENTATSISSIHDVEGQPSSRYDLSGRRMSDDSAARGIVIEQYTDGNGNKHSRKRAQ